MSTPNEDPKSSPFKEIIGNRITLSVIIGTITIGVVGIAFAFIALGSEPEKVKSAFTIIQYIFGTLLPLWGTWIGTILAYYYSKENFESANKSVQQLVDKITSDQKLASVKAKTVMIVRDKLTVQPKKTADLAQYKLKEDCIDFLEQNKIKRVIIVDDKDSACNVIHRDLISYFIASQSIAGQAIKNLTLKDMHDQGGDDIKNTIDNSAKFINENSTLLDAKNLMEQNKTCLDVFITKNGKKEEPILGWITNVTIAENSVV